MKNFFERSACIFRSRCSLVIFLLNVVLNIKELWEDYCYYEKLSEKCSVCQFRMIYLNDFDLYEHSFDFNFLANYHSHFYNNLVKLLGVKNHIVCKLVNTKFYYLHKDWFTGKGIGIIYHIVWTFLRIIKLIKLRITSLK